MPIIPRSFEDCYRIAKAVVAAEMAPPGLDTAEKVMIALMHGLEVGLTPLAALQRIAVVNGRPTIYGDGAMALVRASGACEWVREKIEGDGDARVASCEAKRKGDPEPVRRTFSVAEAKKAGLWSDQARVRRKGKNGEFYEKDNDSPWYRFPDRMLQMRARAFCLRDLFADVLGGLYLKEELEGSEPFNAAPRALPTPPAPPPVAPAAIAPPKPKVVVEPAQGQETLSGEIDFDALRSDLQTATNLDEANGVFDQWLSPREKHMSQDEMDEAQAILREVAAPFWRDGE